jgi:hypothetical protein
VRVFDGVVPSDNTFRLHRALYSDADVVIMDDPLSAGSLSDFVSSGWPIAAPVHAFIYLFESRCIPLRLITEKRTERGAWAGPSKTAFVHENNWKNTRKLVSRSLHIWEELGTRITTEREVSDGCLEGQRLTSVSMGLVYNKSISQNLFKHSNSL